MFQWFRNTPQMSTTGKTPFSRQFLLALGLCMSCPALFAAEVMRVSAVTVPGTPWHDSWLHFQEQLESRPGLIEPRYYLGDQLGSEESALSQLRRGRIQMGGFSLQGASSVVPELGILMSPYLFESFEEVDFVVDNYLQEIFDELFAEKNLVLLAWAEVGWTSVYGSRELRSPTDTSGLKLRSSNALASQLFVQSIGADMVPLTFADILPSLQTGLIQGGEASAIFYALTGLPGEAPHLSLTRHAFDTGMYLANRDWYRGLTKAQRQHLQSSLMRVEDFRVLVRAYEQNILGDPGRFGIKLYQPDERELAAWRQATAGNQPELIESIGGDSKKVAALLARAKAAFRQRAGTIDSAEL